MEINKIKSVNKISMHGNSAQLVRLKNLSAHNNKSENKINRPANQEGFSGSELLYNKQNQVSFTGDPRLVQNVATKIITNSKDKLPQWAEKMGGANWFNKVLGSVDKNEAFYEAAVALVVAGVLKPICVLAMPGAEKEDKEMAATKNAVSAFIGFVLSNVILGPCSNAVNKITKSLNSANPTQYIKDAKYVAALKNDNLVGTAKSTLGEAYKSAYKKFADLGVSPLKASITIALTPIVLKLLFKKNKKEEQPKNPLDNMPVMNAIRLDGTKHAAHKAQSNNLNNSRTLNSIQPQNAVQNPDNTAQVQPAPTFRGNRQNDVSFTGGVDEVIDISKDVVVKNKNILGKIKDGYNNLLGEPIARLFGKVSTTKVAKKIIEGTSHFEKPSPRWSDLTSIAITFFYINNTRKSEKIEPERKLPLMINNGMVTIASSLAAFAIDKVTDKPMEEILQGYLKKHEASIHNKSNINIKRVLSNIKDNLNPTDIDLNNIKNLKNHGKEILEQGKDGLSQGLQEAIKALENDSVIKKAVKDGLIKSEEVAQMAAAGFSQQASKIFSNISKTKSLTIFTITVRFLVTVLMTPLIGRVVALVNKKIGKEEQQAKKPVETKNIPPAGSETIGMKDYISCLNK